MFPSLSGSRQCVRHEIDNHVTLAINQQHVSSDESISDFFWQLRELCQQRRRHLRQLSRLGVRIIYAQNHALSLSLKHGLAQLLSILALEFILQCAPNVVGSFGPKDVTTLSVGPRVSD